MLTSGLDHPHGQVEVTPLTSGAGELDERQLDLLVPVVAALATTPRTELAVDQVREPGHHVEQRLLARGLEVRNARFHEVAGAVQLMRIAQVGEPLTRLDEGEVDIEVAVLLLSAG